MCTGTNYGYCVITVQSRSYFKCPNSDFPDPACLVYVYGKLRIPDFVLFGDDQVFLIPCITSVTQNLNCCTHYLGK